MDQTTYATTFVWAFYASVRSLREKKIEMNQPLLDLSASPQVKMLWIREC